MPLDATYPELSEKNIEQITQSKTVANHNNIINK